MNRKELKKAANEILRAGGQDPEYPYLISRDYKAIREHEETYGEEDLLDLMVSDQGRTPKYIYNENWDCEEW